MTKKTFWKEKNFIQQDVHTNPILDIPSKRNDKRSKLELS